MPRADSLHPSTKVTQSLSKTNSCPKSVLVTPPTPTPVKRGRGRPPKIPKVISADLTPKVPTPESSDGEYQPEGHIIAVMPVVRSRPVRSTSVRTHSVKKLLPRSFSSERTTNFRAKKSIKSIEGPVANTSAHSPTKPSTPEAQKLWTTFVSRLRDVHRRQPDWTKVSVGVKKDLGEMVSEVMLAMDNS